jgi:hypothetical protein
MQKSTKLSRLKSLQQKIEQAGNSAFVEVEPEEMMAFSEESHRQDDNATEAGGPPPVPPKAADYIPPEPEPDSNAPLTEAERRYIENPALMSIYAENPQEIPPRVLARLERLIEQRQEERKHNDEFSWMNF